jgi:hypothetical protein
LVCDGFFVVGSLDSCCIFFDCLLVVALAGLMIFLVACLSMTWDLKISKFQPHTKGSKTKDSKKKQTISKNTQGRVVMLSS